MNPLHQTWGSHQDTRILCSYKYILYIYIECPLGRYKSYNLKSDFFFSGLQTCLFLVSHWYLQDFLNFDDFKCIIPCKFTAYTKDRKVSGHKNDPITIFPTYADDAKVRKAWKIGKAQTLQIALFSHFATLTRNNATKEIPKKGKGEPASTPWNLYKRMPLKGTADKRTAKQELRTKIQRTK